MDVNAGKQKLRHALQRIVDIPDAEWTDFARHLSLQRYGSNEYLTRAGDIHQTYFFVFSGLVRLFYATPDGKEFNKSFLIENDIAGSLDSALTGAPCRYAIQAMEKTHTLKIPAAILQQFYGRHTCWERIGRRMAELLALKKERREAAFLLDSAEQRYLQFQLENPGLDQRIAQYHIASYLGITDVALSRIRRKLANA